MQLCNTSTNTYTKSETIILYNKELFVMNAACTAVINRHIHRSLTTHKLLQLRTRGADIIETALETTYF
jgi:hypothetical protein